MALSSTATQISLTNEQLNDIQGDIWSKGFPKYYEAYYFFAIKPEKNTIFARCLKNLANDPTPLLSTLTKVKKDHDAIQRIKGQPAAVTTKLGTSDKNGSLLSITNALIAFTRKGLDTVMF